MVATSSRTGRPSGSSDISSDAWLCVGLRIIRKYKKTFTTKFILAGLSEWSTQAFHFMKPFLAMRKGKRVRDASIYASKKYRSSFYS